MSQEKGIVLSYGTVVLIYVIYRNKYLMVGLEGNGFVLCHRKKSISISYSK